MQLRQRLPAALQSGEAGLIEEFSNGRKRIAVVLRTDGDIQVELHINGQPGSPFEALFILPQGSEASAVDEIAAFVSDLLEERILLAVDARPLRGGNRWVRPEELDAVQHLAFSASGRPQGQRFRSCGVELPV